MFSSIDKIDMRCIWMLAGVINYKLCDFEFSCENCIFDKVMHGKLPPDNLKTKIEKKSDNNENFKSVSHPSRLINQYLYSIFSDCKINLDRYHHPSHLWFKIESDDIILVGIDKMLIKILQPIDRIFLPKVGMKYQKGQLLVRIMRIDKILPFYSPVSCKILEINNRFLLDSFHQFLENDTYYFKIEGKRLKDEVQKLCKDMQGLQCLTDKVEKVKQYLETTFNQTPLLQMGTTIADGGSLQKCLEKVIGKEAFQNLLNDLLGIVRKEKKEK